MTMASVRSVSVSLRTCIMAKAVSTAPPKAASAPSDSLLPSAWPEENRVRRGQRMTITPNRPTMTAVQRKRCTCSLSSRALNTTMSSGEA